MRCRQLWTQQREDRRLLQQHLPLLLHAWQLHQLLYPQAQLAP